MSAAAGMGSAAARYSRPRPLHVLLDRDVHEVAPLRPRAVVVLDVVDAEQLVQHEPGVRRAFADAAVGDDRLVREALAVVEGGEDLVTVRADRLVARRGRERRGLVGGRVGSRGAALGDPLL